MKIKLYLLACLFLNLNSSNGQVRKIYEGPFDGVEGVGGIYTYPEKGNAKYQYFENEKLDRIYDGFFIFNGVREIIRGEFADNFKNGKWSVSTINKIEKNSNTTDYSVTNLNILGTYYKGLLTGEWKYENSILCYNKLKKIKSKFIESSIAHFSNGIFVGKIMHVTTLKTKQTNEGQFDNNGFKDGIWVYKGGNIVHTVKYKHGLAYFNLKQNITTGEKLDFFDQSNWVDTFWNNYNKETGYSIVNNELVCIDTLPNSPHDWVDDLWIDDAMDIVIFEQTINIKNPLYKMKGSEAPKFYEIYTKECQSKENED